MYSMSSTKDHEKAVDRNVELLKDKLAEYARTGSLCSIPYLLKFCVFDMMSSITVNFEALEGLDDETGVIGLIESAFWCSALLGDLPRLCRGLVWAGRWLGLKPPILCLLKRVLHLRPGRSAAGELSDSFLRRLFILLDEDGTNRQVIEDCCFSNIASGIGKMSIALSAAIYHIYQRPEVLRKLRQELDNMTDVGTLPNSARFEEVLDLPYLQAVIQETLRVHPAIGTMLPRIVPRGGLKIAEYVFPEGTVVGVNPWAANRNAEDYGEDVDEFCPERWLKEGNFQPGSLFSVRKPGIYFWSIEATVY
ncbi:Pisatin demethylase [Metarhizium anisopliae]